MTECDIDNCQVVKNHKRLLDENNKFREFIAQMLLSSNEKEDRILRLLLAYRIFLFENYHLDFNEEGLDRAFCEKYKNAINEVFK